MIRRDEDHEGDGRQFISMMFSHPLRRAERWKETNEIESGICVLQVCFPEALCNLQSGTCARNAQC